MLQEKSVLLKILKEKGMTSEKALEYLYKRIKIKKYNKKEYLISAGERCNSIFVILEGVAHNLIQSNNKNTSYFIGVEGDVMTNPNDFVKSQIPITGQIGIQAITNLIVEEISYDTIQEVYSLYPETKQVAYNLLEVYYIYFFSKYVYLLALSPRERYLSFIQQNKDLIQRVPLKHIASYLGISAESLSRFRAEGLTNKK